MTGTNTQESHPSLRRWRTAFWSAVVATPLVAGVLGILLGARTDGGNQIAVEFSVLIGTVAVVTVLAWRWPRVSGVALGAAAPLIAVTLMWGIVVGAEGVAP